MQWVARGVSQNKTRSVKEKKMDFNRRKSEEEEEEEEIQREGRKYEQTSAKAGDVRKTSSGAEATRTRLIIE